MIFAINDIENPIKVEDKPLDCNKFEPYEFMGSKTVSEAEMFQYFRKHLHLKESIKSRDILNEVDTRYTGTRRPIYSKPNPEPAQISRRYAFPTSGCYIVPKLFEYFPFLDCDTPQMYEDAKLNLAMDDIPYVSYQSSKHDKYWIFCDKQMPFDDTLKFIESYPHDHRYSWIASFKKEFCVRAIPKYMQIPVFVEDHLVSSFTDDFTFWVEKFNKYWESSLIVNYMTTLQTLEEI